MDLVRVYAQHFRQLPAKQQLRLEHRTRDTDLTHATITFHQHLDTIDRFLEQNVDPDPSVEAYACAYAYRLVQLRRN